MKKLSLFTIVLPAVFVSGCLLGPNAARPTLKDFPNNYQENHSSKLSNQDDENILLSINFWKSFNDPILEQLMKEAINSNLSLQQTISRFKQAELSLQQTGASLYPSISATGSASEEKRWNPDSSGENYSVGASASWVIDFFGANRRSIEVAAAELNAAGYSIRDAKLILCSEVARAYFNYRSLQEQYEIAKTNLNLQMQSTEIARAKGEAGFTTGIDVIAAEAQVRSAEAELPNMIAKLNAQQYLIEQLLGKYPGKYTELLKEKTSIPQNGFCPASTPASLLERRPDIRQAEEALNAATARIGVAKANRFPQISISANIGASADALSSWSEGLRTAGFGPRISIPLFEGGKLKTSQKLAEEKAYEALLKYEETVIKAVLEAETALSNYSHEYERKGKLNEALKYYEECVTASQNLYEQGECDFVTVLTHQRNYLNAKRAIVTHEQALSQYAVEVFTAMGGNPIDDESLAQ